MRDPTDRLQPGEAFARAVLMVREAVIAHEQAVVLHDAAAAGFEQAAAAEQNSIRVTNLIRCATTAREFAGAAWERARITRDRLATAEVRQGGQEVAVQPVEPPLRYRVV